MRTAIVGTTGQLALELRRVAPPDGVALLEHARLDLTSAPDLSRFFREHRPQVVVNAGAYTAVDRAETEPDQARALNVTGPATLARLCAEHGSALLHVSTDYVFDGTKTQPYTETDATNPLNVYGQTKLDGELAIRKSLAEHVIVRTSWVFSSHGQNFVKTMLRLAQTRNDLRVVADQFGRPTAAADLARALWHVVAEHSRGRTAWGTFHYASAGRASWFELASAALQLAAPLTGRNPKLEPITAKEYPTPAKRPVNSVLATTRFEQTFRLAPANWREELAHVVRELFANASPSAS